MRTLLHTPRTRGRSLAAATFGALALVGSLLVATPAQAINDTGTGGVFVPASGRVLDTKVGTGGYSTPMEPGSYRTVKITGTAGIPDDGSVGAVSLNASVNGTDSNGTLFGRPDADTSRTMMLIYNGTTGEYVSNSAIVAVSAEGTIQVATETSARLILDVQGYYTSNDEGTAAGGFVPVAGKRIVDTRSGLGATKSTLAPGKSIDIQVAGTNGVPSGASAAVVNLLPINTASSDGYLTPYATGTTRPGNALHYAPSTSTSIQAQVQLSAAGKMTIYNGSSTINLVIDLQGYFTAAGTAGATFTPGIGRVYDSRATGNTVVAKNETRSIQIAGRAGVPVMGSGINSVVLTLTAYHAGSEGRATVWADGTTKPDTTAINFRNDEIRTNTVTVPLGANGKISLNNVADATHYLIDVQGWYSDPAAPVMSCSDPYAAGAWANSTDVSETALSCKFSAPSATSSEQFLQVNLNGAPDQMVPLNAAAETTISLQFDATNGKNRIDAFVSDGVVDGPAVSYEFGAGNWQSEPLAPTVADGTVIAPDQALLLAFPANSGSLPLDAQITYQVTDETTGETSNFPARGAEPAVLENLPRGHVFEWSAELTAADSWTSVATSKSDEWHFRVAAEGEEVSTEPSDDEEVSSVTSDGEATTDASFQMRAKTNGCTGVPQSWGKANFKPVCDRHDICYSKKSKTNRSICDLAFGAGLNAVCWKVYPKNKGTLVALKRTGCLAAANSYYAGVRTLGKAFYKGKGRND